MRAPNPSLDPDGPLKVVASRTILADDAVPRNKSASLARLDSGRLLMTFSRSDGRTPVEGSLMLAHSDDRGDTWSEPRVVYDVPGWSYINMGGLARFSDDHIRLVLGGVKIDYSLGGDEPFSDWYIGHVDSYDGGETWTEPGPIISLFPFWTEMYGASNPHPLTDGRFLFAAMGTMGRDEQWHSGVTFCDPADGYAFSPPVIIANDPERNYSDTDVVRLDDGRLLAVVREHVVRKSVFSHSEDEGETWSPIRYTGFKGSNVKLLKLRSGAVVCAYRDEEPDRRGVSVSLTEDGGESWIPIGQLYAADPDTPHRPGSLCGYPDMVYMTDDEIATVLHTYTSDDGRIDLHLLRLQDRSVG